MSFKNRAFLFFFLISLSVGQIPAPAETEGPAPEESFKENEGLPPPPIVDHENDEYYIKFNELILEFDKNMENMTPDDIITFPIKENSEEVAKYIVIT